MTLPYALENLPGIGGVLKQRPSDFVVHELPAYPPSGDGEHVMIEIEKTGLTTFEAVTQVARCLKVRERDIGYAGLKDKRAITRQWLTIRGTTPEAITDVSTEDLKVLYAERHRNKLRVGHSIGNHFEIKIRDVDPMKVVTLTPALAELSRRGMPNYFGPQRFGRSDRNDRIGLALARSDASAVLSVMLGEPDASAETHDHAARTAYAAGDGAAALNLWPMHGRDERAMLTRLIDGMPAERAVDRIGPRMKDLYLSAMQSRLFNAVVASRVEALDVLLDGDLAWKHANGACFLVTDVAAEQPRAERFEISATGPMLGTRMTRPAGVAMEAERAALAGAGLPLETIAAIYEPTVPRPAAALPAGVWGQDALPGARRPIRVRPDELRAESGIDEHGPYILFAFSLPPGAYATVLLRELMRNDL